MITVEDYSHKAVFKSDTTGFKSVYNIILHYMILEPKEVFWSKAYVTPNKTDEDILETILKFAVDKTEPDKITDAQKKDLLRRGIIEVRKELDGK